MCKKYEFNIQKFKKGQVWYCTEEQEVTDALRRANVHAYNGSRPYFIVHVNGTLITCIPMTTNIGGSDTRRTDITFYNPIADVESRLVISQITTKGANEFTKYLYSISDEDAEFIIRLIRSSIFEDADTVMKNRDAEPEKETRGIKEEKVDVVIDTKQCLIDLETRLRKGVKKGVPIFKTAQEAALWLNAWGDKKTYEIANYFNISVNSVYNWRYCAKKKVKENAR